MCTNRAVRDRIRLPDRAVQRGSLRQGASMTAERDGAGHQHRLRRRAGDRQGARGDPAPQSRPHRARLGGRPVLPVAAVPGRRRDLARGDAPARGPRQPYLPRGHADRGGGRPARRVGGVDGHRAGGRTRRPGRHVGARSGLPALRPPRLPRTARRGARRAAGRGCHGRLRPPRARVEPLPAGHRPVPVPAVRQGR